MRTGPGTGPPRGGVVGAHRALIGALSRVGSALEEAFRERDYPVLQIIVLVAAIAYVLVNLLVDILYALIDPRVRP